MSLMPFLNKVLLGAFFLPAFITSVELTNEVQQLDLSAARKEVHCEADGAVFASYRNNGNQFSVFAGSTLKFNVKNANKGHGIKYDEDRGVFSVRKAGFYQIVYGAASIGNAGLVTLSFGFNVIRTRECSSELIDSFLANGSSAIIVYLREGDEIAIVSQETVTLIAGSLPPLTTTLTDTSYISFLRLDR